MQMVAKSGQIIVEAKPWSLIGPLNQSLMDALFPSINIFHRVAISLLLVGVLVAFGRATFYLPGNPVPISFQTTGVLLMVWRPRAPVGPFCHTRILLPGDGGRSQVFKDGGNGWAYVSGSVTAGYIIGFIASVPIVGYLSQHGWNRGRILWPMLLGNLFIYVPGLLWLHFFDLGWPAEGELFKGGMYPFIPGDLVKLMLASVVVGFGWSIADRRKSSEE